MAELLKRDYVVFSELGRGRFGVVSRCVAVDSGESFAVKSIDKQVITAGDSLDAQCLLTEPKILQLLSHHPHITTVRGIYEDEAYLHMVIDLCSSSDLHTRIISRVIPEPEAASVMRQLMQAVAHCHRLGVAHRDIKPDNILFDEENQLKLADFGSAELFMEGELMSGVVGTPYYVAPEVLAGGEYNEKVDVWSAGIVLYVMLAGFPPFYGDSAVEIFEAVLRGNLRFPSRAFHGVSSAAKDLLRRMLSRDVSRRFSAEQVLRHPWFNIAGECIAAGSMVVPRKSDVGWHKLNTEGTTKENLDLADCRVLIRDTNGECWSETTYLRKQFCKDNGCLKSNNGKYVKLWRRIRYMLRMGRELRMLHTLKKGNKYVD